MFVLVNLIMCDVVFTIKGMAYISLEGLCFKKTRYFIARVLRDDNYSQGIIINKQIELV